MRLLALPLCWVLLAMACGSRTEQEHATASQRAKSATDSRSASGCPANDVKAPPLPGVHEKQLTLAYWLERIGRRHDLDQVVLSAKDIARHNRAVGRRGDGSVVSQMDLTAPLDVAKLTHDIGERLRHTRERLESASYVDGRGERLSRDVVAAYDGAHLRALSSAPLYVVIEPVLMRCGPYDAPLFAADSDRTFDRNACSQARAQDLVQVIGTWPNGMRLVRTSYATGWMPASAKLSLAVPETLVTALAHGPRMRATQPRTLIAEDGEKIAIATGTALPLDASTKRHLWVAGAKGLTRAPFDDGWVSTRAPLTRRAVLREAFSHIGSPYGFGDADGGIDCSRLLMDVFSAFDLALPRHSGWQAQAGTYAMDVAALPVRQKQQLIDLADDAGLVLLQLPGHIMLYLGRDDDQRPMVLHALGEFAAPCPVADGKRAKGDVAAPASGTEAETVFRIKRVTVNDLTLGEGSSRRALIERISRIVVLGPPPNHGLQDAVVWRPAAPTTLDDLKTCQDDVDARIFASPANAHAGAPLRVLLTSTDAYAPAILRLFDPRGDPVPIEPTALGGPPYGAWIKVAQPAPGTWIAALADGDNILACKRIRVGAKPAAPAAHAPEGPAWTPRWTWERDTENLYAAFVEQLFSFPLGDERTWPDLHSLLRDADHNLLYDHLGLGEDAALELQPDCADLPYILRAYFAWKMRLPFGYRKCSRGRPGMPPRCGPLQTHLDPSPASDALSAFAHFANRNVRWGVHSASGRTSPVDEDTDLYPVALTKRALPPGTVYADPYGHVMLIAKWYPQGIGLGDYGVLMAAEAQPDGTISRRRFWPGSFLFTPETDEVGAGFKAFRPLRYDAPSGSITALDNATLKTKASASVAGSTRHFPPFSLEQYEGSAQDFYDRMEALINPRPLDAAARLDSLIDALQEQLERRVISVDNGERYVNEHRASAIPMPSGHAIFETTGPWEDFATPSRDMRLLIAIDTVTQFLDRVQRRPDAYGLRPGAELDDALSHLETHLRDSLKQRSVTYTRTDGSARTVSLGDVVARVQALEVAYNPNDCVEHRWGAPHDSEEAATCRRRAPSEQRARMDRYRSWFHDRTRPRRDVRD